MTDSETLDKARALFVGQTQGDTLAREVIAIAERLLGLIPRCKRCNIADDGRKTCLVDCNDCHGSKLAPNGRGSCHRCYGTGKYQTGHLILTDDPCEGMVEIGADGKAVVNRYAVAEKVKPRP